jgi:hypothetical protein
MDAESNERDFQNNRAKHSQVYRDLRRHNENRIHATRALEARRPYWTETAVQPVPPRRSQQRP